jgi:hypothetical protein
LGCLPLWGRVGVNLTTTTEYLLNNSYIEDFSRAKNPISLRRFLKIYSEGGRILKREPCASDH